MFVAPKMFPDAVISRFRAGKISSSSPGKWTSPVELTLVAVIVGALVPLPICTRLASASREKVVHCTLKMWLGGIVNVTVGLTVPSTLNPRTSGSVHATLPKHDPFGAKGWL